MKLELLLEQLMHVKPLSATWAMFAALPEKDQISATLIEWVEKFVGAEPRDERENGSGQRRLRWSWRRRRRRRTRRRKRR